MSDDSLKSREELLTEIQELRKQTHEELLRIRQAIDDSSDAIILADVTGRFFYQNKTFARLVELSCDELNRLGLDALYGEPHRARDVFHAVLAGDCRQCEIEVVSKQGRNVPVLLRANAARDEAGDIVGFIAIHTDIEERKRSEAALHTAKLETEVVNHKLELSIKRANEMAVHARMANRAKSEFLATVSHEIRTPMNAIIGMTGLLQETMLNPEQREFTETVKNSADSLLSIVNDILDFSKIEAGKLELETLDFNLRVTLEDTGDLLAHRAQNKNLEFICIVDPVIPTQLQGDPGRLRQILLNLANNAIKFTHEGEVSIRVGLLEEDEQSVTLRFSVSDTGIGIPVEKHSLLFEAFTQLDSSNTRQYEGTGLGLSICKKLTEMMGGEIGVESKFGEGATFWFTVKLRKQPQKERLAAFSTSIAKKRVLVVDDNATNRRWLTLLLKSWNCFYAEAADAQSALRKLESAAHCAEPYDAAIIDWQMPVISGEMLGTMIKKSEVLKSLQLIMMTSIARSGDARRLEKIGFAAYLTKPVKQAVVYDCLRLVLHADPSPNLETQKRIITRFTIADAKYNNYRILLAEDNVPNQKVVRRILEKYGYRVDAVANGLEAVQALETIPYDLVLMDCQMPDMDGYEATRTIRSLNSMVINHNIPIVAMTANAMQGDREKCIFAGMDEYLAKPIDLQRLLHVVETWLQKSEENKVEKKPPVPVQDQTIIFDKQDLLRRMLGDGNYARILVDGFLKDAPELITKIRCAIEQNDTASVHRHGHTLKGASGNISAKAFWTLAHQMEMAGKTSDLVSAGQLLPQLQRCFEEVKEILQQSWVKS